jgi:hypothetical protein
LDRFCKKKVTGKKVEKFDDPKIKLSTRNLQTGVEAIKVSLLVYQNIEGIQYVSAFFTQSIIILYRFERLSFFQ